MEMSTITGREFNQDASGAKRRAARGPVFITDRGRPAHVLLSIEEYNRLTSKGMSVLDSIAQPAGRGAFDYDFEPFRDRAPGRPFDFDGG